MLFVFVCIWWCPSHTLLWFSSSCVPYIIASLSGLSIFDCPFGILWFMVFNASLSNASVISWRSVLLVEEQFEQYFSYIVEVSFIGGRNQSTRRKPPTNFITQCCIEYTSPWTGIELTTLLVIGTDCKGSCKSNYNTLTTTTAPATVNIRGQSKLQLS
jgi:hypothetical protein